MEQLISASRELREKYISDKHRPGYHIVSPEGMCVPFDPNGAIYWKGRYHLMYITQIEEKHCWGHISSTDLIHWRHHPVALKPGDIDNTIFSGGAFIDKNGVPTISYWGLGEKAGICLATSTDDQLDCWTKHPDNPVINQTDKNGLAFAPDGEPIGVADPSDIWIKNGKYYMLGGNYAVLHNYGLDQGIEKHKGDTLFLFESDDLVNWKYLHRFYDSKREWTNEDEDCMCAEFFPIGNKYMILFISHNHGCQYYLGQYVNDRFIPETHGRMSWRRQHCFRS